MTQICLYCYSFWRKQELKWSICTLQDISIKDSPDGYEMSTDESDQVDAASDVSIRDIERLGKTEIESDDPTDGELTDPDYEPPAERVVREKSAPTAKKCAVCGAELESIQAYKQHFLDDHLNLEGRYFCPQDNCPRNYPTRETLLEHTKRHSGPNQVCPTCGKMYFAKSLKSHMAICNTEKTVPCPSCDRMFTNKSLLRLHTYRVHCDMRPFLCTHCGKSFKIKYELFQHTMIHTKEQPYKCKDCGRGFNHPSNLRQHIRKHTGALPYMCDLCGERFRYNVSMKTHRRKHWNLQPQVCYRDAATHTYLVDGVTGFESQWEPFFWSSSQYRSKKKSLCVRSVFSHCHSETWRMILRK